MQKWSKLDVEVNLKHMIYPDFKAERVLKTVLCIKNT